MIVESLHIDNSIAVDAMIGWLVVDTNKKVDKTA